MRPHHLAAAMKPYAPNTCCSITQSGTQDTTKSKLGRTGHTLEQVTTHPVCTIKTSQNQLYEHPHSAVLAIPSSAPSTLCSPCQPPSMHPPFARSHHRINETQPIHASMARRMGINKRQRSPHRADFARQPLGVLQSTDSYTPPASPALTTPAPPHMWAPRSLVFIHNYPWGGRS